MNKILPTLLTALLVLASNQVSAFDVAEGESLVNGNCTSCHGSELYTRKNRLVSSRPGLSKQVKRCELALGLTWFDEDVENAAEYLNQRFYRFAK
ncbi:MAG: cytochrome c [Gammaproteobacteria bacterium]|nr:cytochrome c [Gammaproteobacteria bacterium]